jgi:hypothetical protein
VEFFDAVEEVLSQGQLIGHPFVSCLSLDGNSLDQWRNYADDGRGYAIGFQARALRQLPISLLQVSYDVEEQVREMMAALVALHFREPELPLSGTAFEDASLIAAFMTALKHPCFQSEREVRCLRAISLEGGGSNYRFIDRGGLGRNGVEIPGEKVCYATRSGSLTAFVDIPYTLPAEECPITEVTLGPKNGTGLGNVFLFLGSLGHGSIRVRPSNLPYR